MFYLILCIFHDRRVKVRCFHDDEYERARKCYFRLREIAKKSNKFKSIEWSLMAGDLYSNESNVWKKGDFYLRILEDGAYGVEAIKSWRDRKNEARD